MLLADPVRPPLLLPKRPNRTQLHDRPYDVQLGELLAIARIHGYQPLIVFTAVTSPGLGSVISRYLDSGYCMIESWS